MIKKPPLEHKPGDTYLVTGLLYNTTKRFRLEFDNPMQAMCVNLWRGRVYQVRNGKKTKIKSVHN